MRHLIVFAHPNHESLNGSIKKMLVEHLLEKGHEVEVRDLYHMNFNPILSLNDINGQKKGQVASDVEQEQAFISWSDCITLIYPIWWTGLPAILKGYIDRVLSYGFAYRYDQGVQKGLLIGKETVIINTHGKSRTEYETIGMDKALSLTSDRGIYTYCGLAVKQHFYFDNADRATAGTIEAWSDKIKSVY